MQGHGLGVKTSAREQGATLCGGWDGPFPQEFDPSNSVRKRLYLALFTKEDTRLRDGELAPAVPLQASACSGLAATQPPHGQLELPHSMGISQKNQAETLPHCDLASEVM